MAVLLYAQIFGLMLLANAVVYMGIFFINGGLMAGLLAPIYQVTGPVIRTLICLVSFLTLGNILFAWGFAKFNPALVAPINIVAFVFIQVAIAFLVSKTWPGWMIVPALSVVIAGCMWVYYLIDLAARSNT